jgi:hypothetical protein
MKTFQNIFKVLTGVGFLGLVMVSCLPEQESMGDAGQTLVKFTPADFKMIALDAKASAQTSDMFIVRKDASNNAALNKESIVVLKKDDALLTAYNTENGTTLVALPSTLCTISPAPAANGDITLTFAPGDAAKLVTITIPDATKFDFSKQYALAYSLNVTGEGIPSQAGNVVVVQVLVKNKFDGKYEVTGTLVDLANSTITGNYPMSVNLVTTGALQVRFEEPADLPWGSVIFHSIQSGGAMSVYGAFGLLVNFDANNKVASVVNYYGQPASNTRSAELDPSGVNTFDPATKTIKIKYFMKQPSVVPAAPNIRTTFDEVWKYKGVR